MLDFDEVSKKLTKEMSKKDRRKLTKMEKPSSEVLTDCYGRTFDPNLHFSKNGRPTLTKSGFLRCMPNCAVPISQICSLENYERLQNESQKLSHDFTSKDIENNSKIMSDNQDHNAHAGNYEEVPQWGGTLHSAESALPMGAASAEIIFILGQSIGGEEWTPSNQERVTIQSAFSQYYTAKGYDDLPPGMILATALVTYIAPRLRKPKTQGKLKSFYFYLRGKLTRNRYHSDKKSANG